MTQHQSRDGVALRQFNLRHRFTGVHAKNKFAQWQQKRTDFGGQNSASFDIGHITAFAFMKTNEHFTFFMNIAH